MMITAGMPTPEASQAPSPAPHPDPSPAPPTAGRARTFGFDWDLRTDAIRRDAAAADLGLAPTGSGSAFMGLMHPADREAFHAALDAVAPDRPTYRARYRLHTSVGERTLQDQGRVRFDAAGAAIALSTVSADVTADARADVHNNRRLDLLVDVMDRLPAMVMVYDTAFAGVRVNRSMTDILGWDRHALAAGEPLSLWCPDPAERARAAAVLLNDAGGWTDLPMQARDGRRVEVAWASASLPDGRRVAVGVEVGEQRRAERRLAALERRFRTMAETVPDILFTADADGRADYVNERFYRVTGLAPGSARRHGWLRALHPDDRAEARVRWQEAVARGSVLRLRYRLRCADGSYRWWESRARPIADPQDPDAPPTWFGAASDVDELVRTREALEVADRQKDEFLAILGHELRNPMAPVRSAVDLMGTLALPDPRLAWAVGVVDRQTRQMDRLLDDLLDVSRIIRGKLRLAPRVVSAAEVAAQAVDASQQQLEARGHRFRMTLPEQAVYLNADPARLAQVLTNLLNNAAKYTPEGGHIELRVTACAETVALEVADDGDGIDTALRAHLFRTFTQGSRRLERIGGGGKAGLGLGLAIAGRLTELHGGRIEVVSPGPGQGTTFRVVLPAADAPAAASAVGPSAHDVEPAALSVLVVDDHADAADGLGMLLEALGHHVRVCHGGAEALAAAARERPRVVLLDLGMDDMDGFETARRLRALEREPPGANARDAPPRMLLAAVSGYGDGGTRARGRAAGIDRHLTKPVSRQALTALLRDAALARARC